MAAPKKNAQSKGITPPTDVKSKYLTMSMWKPRHMRKGRGGKG